MITGIVVGFLGAVIIDSFYFFLVIRKKKSLFITKGYYLITMFAIWFMTFFILGNSVVPPKIGDFLPSSIEIIHQEKLDSLFNDNIFVLNTESVHVISLESVPCKMLKSEAKISYDDENTRSIVWLRTVFDNPKHNRFARPREWVEIRLKKKRDVFHPKHMF